MLKMKTITHTTIATINSARLKSPIVSFLLSFSLGSAKDRTVGGRFPFRSIPLSRACFMLQEREIWRSIESDLFLPRLFKRSDVFLSWLLSSSLCLLPLQFLLTLVFAKKFMKGLTKNQFGFKWGSPFQTMSLAVSAGRKRVPLYFNFGKVSFLMK